MIWSIWDLDGCLSDDSARKYLVTGPSRTKDYDTYHALCPDDPPRAPELSLMVAWRQAFATGRRVAIFTGRPERWREETRGWLAKHCALEYVDELVMRPDSSSASVDVLKQFMFQNLLTAYPGSEVVFAVDDRTKVIEMWKAMEVPCLQSIDGVHPSRWLTDGGEHE